MMRPIPCDFIAFAKLLNPLGRHHHVRLANVFAPTEALAFGKTLEQAKAEGVPDWLAPHRYSRATAQRTRFPQKRAPEAPGKLIALYEHAVFVQGAVWQINSFDQCRAEAGKFLAQRVIPEIESRTEPSPARDDSSTNNLIRRYRRTQHAS